MRRMSIVLSLLLAPALILSACRCAAPTPELTEEAKAEEESDQDCLYRTTRRIY